MTDRPENRPEFPHETTLFQGGWEAGDLVFESGNALFARIEELAAAGGPAEHLDAAMGGKAAPRTWLLVHPPGRGELSAAVALVFARELAQRGQSALVLDADETDGALTEWIGRTEAEGWIDLARYGTSVLTSGENLPFEGRRGYVLGVGSFTPTDVTDEEIGALMARLRRQADDILVVAAADELGAAWARSADARLFCWDPETTNRAEAGVMAELFDRVGHPLTGVVAFGDVPASGLSGSEERLVEEVLAESLEPEPEVIDHEGFDDGPVPEDEAAVDESAAESAAESDAEAEAEPAAAVAADGGDDSWGAPPPGPGDYGESEEPRRGTSLVFWVGAVAAVLVITVAFIYYFKVLRVPSEGHFESTPVASRTEPVPARSDMVTHETPAEVAADSTADSTVHAAADSALAAADTVALATDEDPAGDDAPAAQPPVDEPGADEVVGRESDPGAESADPGGATTPADAFDMASYGTPVGEKGWALHVYSLPSMEALQLELKELDRRRFKTAVKAVDIEGKGRWYRVFLGDFASRAEAEAAKPALLEKLGADYAAAKRFESTTSE